MTNVPTIISKENDSALFRLDKNIAFNILEFNKIEDNYTRSIVKSLVMYFSFQYQKDLFGYGTIDLNDFSEKMNLNRTNLSRKNPAPKCIADGYKEGTFNTYLENALYILTTTTIFEEYKGSTNSHDFIGLKNYIIIKELSVYTEKTKAGGTPKKFYKYKLDETFERNLKKFFLITNLKTYLGTKTFNGEDFYLQLKNIYHSSNIKGINGYRWNFNYILEYFNINDKEVKQQKKKLNIIFKKYEELLKDEIKGISFYWEKETDKNKYAYTACVKWTKIEVELVKKENFSERGQLFLDTLKRSLYDIFLTQTNTGLPNHDRTQEKKFNMFYNWIQNKENDDIIKNTYLSVYLSLFKTQSFPSPATFATSFLNKKNELKGENLSSLFENIS